MASDCADSLMTTCVECGRELTRRAATTISVHTELPDGGYEFVPMPACSRCKLEREGIPCEECGELHRTHEAAYECCIGRTKAPDCPECGRRMAVAAAGYSAHEGQTITIAECECCPVMWGRFTGWELTNDDACKHVEEAGQ